MTKSKKHQLAIVPGQTNTIKVNGNLDFALKVLKRQLKDSGIMDLVKERKEFTKKSVIERENYRKARFLQQKFSERERKN